MTDTPTPGQLASAAYVALPGARRGAPWADLPAWEQLSNKEHAAWSYAVDKVEESLAGVYARRTHT